VRTALETIARGLPPDFVFGSGTSAYQIEGGRDAKKGCFNADKKGISHDRDSIWDRWCDEDRAGAGVTGDKACDHYRLWEDDCRIIRDIGLGSYRFSIAWTRIICSHEIDAADGSVRVIVDPEGMAFYRTLMERLVADGVELMPTLHRCDLPQSLQDAVGGWLSPLTATAFAAYARDAPLRLWSAGQRLDQCRVRQMRCHCCQTSLQCRRARVTDGARQTGSFPCMVHHAS